MRVMIVGSGGREHALAWAIAKSSSLNSLFCAPGNPGTAAIARNLAVSASDIAGLVAVARAEAIDLVVVGPEAPLVAGLADALAAAGIACFGPSAAAAALEGSKAFTKIVCDEAQIPTAAWARFDAVEPALDYVRAQGAPIVIKADGLAAGKGVVVAETLAEAEEAVIAFLRDGAMGEAGRSLVIEDCLRGEEVSLFALCDGTDCVLLGAAQDHKRVGDGDTGPNTGGMGAISPPPGFDHAAQLAALDVFVRPALRVMAQRGTPFRGFLFAGLMLTPAGPRLIEYNVRLGDPEAETLLVRLRSDLLTALEACVRGALSEVSFTLADAASACVVVAAAGYPAAPRSGGEITGLEAAGADDDVIIFQAGTAWRDGRLVASGGRVLAVSALAADLAAARARAYAAVARIDYADAQFRRDIGARAVDRAAALAASRDAAPN